MSVASVSLSSGCTAYDYNFIIPARLFNVLL